MWHLDETQENTPADAGSVSIGTPQHPSTNSMGNSRFGCLPGTLTGRRLPGLLAVSMFYTYIVNDNVSVCPAAFAGLSVTNENKPFCHL
jgi:hypothetical protein